MADLFRKTKSLFSTTSNSFGSGTAETITLSSASGLPTDTEITLTFDRSVAGKLERIIGTVSGTNFAIRTSPSTGRGADSTTDQSHTSPTVEYAPNAKDINDMVDAILVEHSQTGAHGATFVKTSGAQTLTGAKTFTTGLLKAVDVTSGAGVSTFPTSTDTLVGRATTDTLTNKRWTKKVISATSYTTDTGSSLNCDNCTDFIVTAQAGALKFNNPGGTPTDQQTLWLAVTGTAARALTWDTQFEPSTAALPTTTVTTARLDIAFVWRADNSKWRCVGAL